MMRWLCVFICSLFGVCVLVNLGVGVMVVDGLVLILLMNVFLIVCGGDVVGVLVMFDVCY